MGRLAPAVRRKRQRTSVCHIFAANRKASGRRGLSGDRIPGFGQHLPVAPVHIAQGPDQVGPERGGPAQPHVTTPPPHPPVLHGHHHPRPSPPPPHPLPS